MPSRRPGSRHESLLREERLSRRADFLRCYRKGRRRHGPLATLHVHPNQESIARLGITASRKVGNAVARHKVKRRVREIFRRWVDRESLSGLDLVVHLKPTSSQVGFGEFRDELLRIFAAVPKRQSERSASKSGPRAEGGRPDRADGRPRDNNLADEQIESSARESARR